jgi:hypothetical protein
MYLWLDDDQEWRKPKDSGWTWVFTAKEAIHTMEANDLVVASLDHDLGPHGGTGYEVVLWMAANDRWPSERVVVHSHNPVGSKNMCATVDRYGPYDEPCVHAPYGSYRHAQVLGKWEWLSDGR